MRASAATRSISKSKPPKSVASTVARITSAWTLPISKSDPTAQGVTRALDCICGSRFPSNGLSSHDSCAACRLLEQASWVRATWPVLPQDHVDPASVPLWPAAASTLHDTPPRIPAWCSKSAIVATIRSAAQWLATPSASGAPSTTDTTEWKCFAYKHWPGTQRQRS